MRKLETIEDLAKAVGGLTQHFQKAAAHHKAVSDAHVALAEAHKGHATFLKAKHEAMDDADAHKTYFGKAAEFHTAKATHHTTKATLHKAHAEHLTGLADSLGDEQKTAKAAGASAAAPAAGAPPAGAGDGTAPKGIDALVTETTQTLVKSSLEMIKTDPTIQDEIRKMVLDGIKTALGDKIIPDGVKGFLPGAPATGTRLVPRPGGPGAEDAIDVSQIAPENRELVEAS